MFDLLPSHSEAPLSLLKIENRLVKVLFPKVRPVYVCKVQLSIRKLPEQVITDPVFSTGSDHKLGIGHVGCCQVIAYHLFIDLVWRDRTILTVNGYSTGRLGYLPSRTVV